jgi:hypothetical protein
VERVELINEVAIRQLTDLQHTFSRSEIVLVKLAMNAWQRLIDIETHQELVEGNIDNGLLCVDIGIQQRGRQKRRKVISLLIRHVRGWSNGQFGNLFRNVRDIVCYIKLYTNSIRRVAGEAQDLVQSCIADNP